MNTTSKRRPQGNGPSEVNWLKWNHPVAMTAIISVITMTGAVSAMLATTVAAGLIVLFAGAGLLAWYAVAVMLLRMIEILNTIRFDMAALRAQADTTFAPMAADLAAMRNHMNKGVLGLLGM